MLGSTSGKIRRRIGGWAQEERRRFAFRGRGNGVEQGVSGAREMGWQASWMYVLSVHETSRMFFSLHQVRILSVVNRFPMCSLRWSKA